MELATAIDTVLDRTIALGYGDVGPSDDDPRDRRRLWELCQSLIES